MQVWKHIDGQVLPTALVFGPDSLPIFIFEGENHVQHLKTFLTPIFDYYKSSVRVSPTSSAMVKSSSEDIATSDAAAGKQLFE